MQQENAFITKFLTTALIIGLSFAGFFFTNFLAKESFDKSIQQQNICRIIPGSQVINTSFELSKFVKKQNRIFISGFFVFDFKKDVEFFDVIENFDLRTGKILSKKTSFIKLADENDKMRIDLKLSLPADSENTFYPLLFDKCRIKIVNELMMADQSCFKIKNFISKKKEKVSAALMSYFEKKEMFDEPAIAINLYKTYSTDWIQFLSLIMFILFFSLYFAHNITGQIGLDKFLFLGYLIVAALPYLILKQSLPILSIIIASQVLSILSKVFMNAFYKTSSIIYELINLIIFSTLGIIFGALILF